MKRTTLVVLAFLAAAAPAPAQETKDAIKKRILAKVEEYLKKEEERILKEIEKVIDEELAKGAPPAEKKAGYLGVRLADLSAEDREQLGLGEGEGVLVAQVVDGLPAQKAGLQEGDVILAIDTQKVGSVAVMVEAVKKAGAGTEVKLKVLRGDEDKEIAVKLGEAPAAKPVEPPEPKKEEPQGAAGREEMKKRIRAFLEKEGATEPAPGFLGIRVEDSKDGVRIAEVRPGSPAEKAGMRAGQSLLKVGDSSVKSEQEMSRVLRRLTAGETVVFTVREDGKERALKATLTPKE